jgi:molecular chaperone GrpE
MSKKNRENKDAVDQDQPQAEAEQATAEAEPEALEAPDIAKLEQELEEAQAKATENWENVLRLQAELENTRRRAERDVQGAHKFALEKFVNELLPVKDSLEMGEAAAQVEDTDLEKVREGIELTLKMMTDVMGKFGVAEVNPVGQPFNPDLHQAMSMQDVPDAKPNTVVTVYQKGYQLNDRLVRPAMVVVASANSGADAPSEGGNGGNIDEMA